MPLDVAGFVNCQLNAWFTLSVKLGLLSACSCCYCRCRHRRRLSPLWLLSSPSSLAAIVAVVVIVVTIFFRWSHLPQCCLLQPHVNHNWARHMWFYRRRRRDSVDNDNVDDKDEHVQTRCDRKDGGCGLFPFRFELLSKYIYLV